MLGDVHSHALAHPVALARAHAIPSTAYRQGVAYALIAGIALGTLGPISNLAYAAGMGSATFAALRATIGTVVLVAVMVVGDHPRVRLRGLPPRDRWLLALTATAQAALSLCLFAAYGAMAVALVLAVYFCYPLVVALAPVALGRERLTATRVVALVIALAGLVTVVLAGQTLGLAISAVGLTLAVAASLCQASYLVISRASFTSVPSEQAVAVILAIAACLMWTVAISVDAASGRLLAWVTRPEAWIAIAIAGVVGAALAKVCMLRGVRRVGGTRASVLMLAEPLVGVVLAAVLLGQGLAPAQIIGGIGVLAGALLAQRPAPARAVRSRTA